MYNCMRSFLHYVHCKDTLLDCSAPGGERCESLTWVDEIGENINIYREHILDKVYTFKKSHVNRQTKGFTRWVWHWYVSPSFFAVSRWKKKKSVGQYIWILMEHVNSLRASDAYMRRQQRPSLVQIMVCRLFGARPFIWTNAGILIIGPLGTYFSEIWI